MPSPIKKRLAPWEIEYAYFIESVREVDANAACWLEENETGKEKFIKEEPVSRTANGRVNLARLFGWSHTPQKSSYWAILNQKCKNMEE